jgi:threonylcarbamoyladenosine tRNA methylthiotransferase MtaB
MGHIFPYSPKKGTPAERMPQVAPALVKERARRLRERSAERRALWLQRLTGTRQKVLVERESGLGHSENFAPVRVPGGTVGAVEDVLVVARDGDTLVGEKV